MKKNLILLFTISINYLCNAQGTFQNLNFEAANVAGYSPGSSGVPFTNAFPGWSGLGTAYYDFLSAGGPLIAINDSGSGLMPLQGIYSLYMAGGSHSTDPVAISQTGLVPGNSKSLTMDVLLGGNATFLVTMGGQTITMVPLQNTPNYVVYGGDISAFAGQNTTLTLTAPSVGINASFLLDDIIFSPQSIPEPAVWAIMLCGGALIVTSRRKAKS